MRYAIRIRSWWGLVVEAGGTLFLVLLLYWLFIVLLYALFPAGKPLRELIEGSLEPVPTSTGRSAEATLATLERDVRIRRGNSIAWGGADAGMQLFSQDAVQTFDRSGAGISFGGGDRLALGSNSLLVVTRLNARDDEGPRSYRVQVAGELSGSLRASRRLRLEIAAAGHLARVEPGAARFRICANDDNSESLSVYSGELRIVRNGEPVRVPANYGITLRQGAPVGPAQPLPEAPLRRTPDPAVYRYRSLPPWVRLTWSGGAGEYHFQLARNPGFSRCLIDAKLGESEYATSKLDAGSYFWRVSRLAGGREGRFSSTGRLELVRLSTPPELSVRFPSDAAVPGMFRLEGRTELGVRVYVDGVEAATGPGGGFGAPLVVRPGVNLIRVEAVDAAGNASYASRIVYGRN